MTTALLAGTREFLEQRNMETLWAILLKSCGAESMRIPLTNSRDRSILPLRALAQEGLRHEAAGLVIVRHAVDAACSPCTLERGAIGTARDTLAAIGLRLHDYILWHGTRSVSLRASGQI